MSGITDDDSRIPIAARRPSSDPPFKLFGQTIPIVSAKLREDEASNESHCFQDLGDEGHHSECQSSVQDEVGSSSGSNDGCDESDKAIEAASEKSQNPSLTAEDSGELVSFKVKNESCEEEEGEEQEHGEEGTVHVSMEQQAPKKPDKPVACPRCQSLETKFCYYNNYNVNQPRHFCKNCQRYWTAGGTLRNVPVGSGRRKSKHGSSSCHQRNGFSDGLLVRGDAPENAQQMLPSHGNSTASKGNGNVNRYSKTGISTSMDAHIVENTASPRSTVLNFSQETSVCKTGNSMSVPVRSEVLQGYKPSVSMNAQMEPGFLMAQAVNAKVETGLSMGHSLNGKVEPVFSVPQTLNAKVEPGFFMPKMESDFKQSKQLPLQNGKIKSPCTVPVIQTADVRFVEPMQLHIPSAATGTTTTNITSTNTITSSEVHSGSTADAGLPWSTNPQFPLVNAPWQYGWGSMPHAASFAQDSSAGSSTNSSTTNMVAQPPWAAFWSGIPWPLLQNPLMVPPAWAGPWPMPWAAAAAAPVTAAAAVAVASAASAGNQTLASPMLGKHPREQGELDGEKGGKLLFPKTLRIGDPDEAAQSSIWTALGLARRSDMCASGGMFCNMQSKDTADAISQEVQKSNPAAVRRSMAFHEGNVATHHVDVKGK